KLAARAVAIQSLVTPGHEVPGCGALAGSRHTHHQHNLSLRIRWLRNVHPRCMKRTAGRKPLIELLSIALAQLKRNYTFDGARCNFARWSRNRNDMRRQGEQPGQRNFLRCSVVPCRDLGYYRIACLPLMAAAAEWAVGNQLDAVIATVLDHAVAQVFIIEYA